MGIGVSVFLITIGAILRFAITVTVSGVDIQAMGVILMIVGGAWLVVSVLVLMRRRDAESDSGDQHGQYSDSHPPAPPV